MNGGELHYPEIKDEEQRKESESEKMNYEDNDDERIKRDKKKKKKHRHHSQKKYEGYLSQDEEILDFDVERGTGEGLPAFE